MSWKRLSYASSARSVSSRSVASRATETISSSPVAGSRTERPVTSAQIALPSGRTTRIVIRSVAPSVSASLASRSRDSLWWAGSIRSNAEVPTSVSGGRP